MNIVFYGSPEAALPSLERLLEAGHEILLVVTQPDRPSGRGKALCRPPVKAFALKNGIPVIQPDRIRKDETVLERLKQIRPDIQVIVAYGQIIPSPIIHLPRHHSINVHFSLLPKYRGASPVQWAILNGERTTGVTIFELTEKMDEGDILSREETEILPREKAFELENRLARLGSNLLVNTLAGIDRITLEPQDHSRATYASKLEKDQGRIDWTADAAAVDRKVRAFAAWPAAFAFLQSRRVIIRSGLNLEIPPAAGLPGEVISVGKSGLDVACGAGSVYRIERLQRENKKELDAYSFSLGMELTPGDRFE